jgi:protein tyrosine/serine phosphatase
LRTAEAPMLLHCKSGADRAGLASAVAVLVHGGTAEQALRQLSLRFGHFSASRTGVLDAFIRTYRDQAEGRLSFLDWVATEYDADALLRSFRANAAVSAFVDRVLRRE